MSSSTAQSLYSRDVLRLATSLPHNERLETPDGSATCRAPLCGSEMSVDVAMDAGRVTAIAIRARACALGQASAAILLAEAAGLDLADIQALRDAVEAALAAKGDMPSAWAALAYARDYPARHGAILLPLDTLLKAMA